MLKGQTLLTILAVNPPHLLAPEFLEALALLSIGLKLDRKVNAGSVCEFKETVGDQVERRFQFVFDPMVKVDGCDFSDWQKRWNDREWMAKNPVHPLRCFREYADNYARLAEWMKGHDPILVFRNPTSGESERAAYVPESLMGTERGTELLKGAGLAA